MFRTQPCFPLLSFSLLALSACGSDDAPLSKGGPIFGDLGGNITNTVDKAGFMNKAKEASQVLAKGKSQLGSLEGARGRNAASLAWEPSAITSATGSDALSTLPRGPQLEEGEDELKDADWGDFSDSGSGYELSYGDYGESFESCGGVMGAIKQEYDNTLALVKEQFKVLKALDSEEAAAAGLKALDLPNRAVAYAFSEQGMKGTIEGAADDSRVLVLMTLASQEPSEQESSGDECTAPEDSGEDDFAPPGFPSPDDSSDLPIVPGDICETSSKDEIGIEGGFEQGFGMGMSPSAQMKVEMGFLANLAEQIIDVRSKLDIADPEGLSIGMMMDGRVAAGKEPELRQRMEMSVRNTKTSEGFNFNMTFSARQVDASTLQVELSSSGIKEGELNVPPANETITLRAESDGSCALVAN